MSFVYLVECDVGEGVGALPMHARAYYKIGVAANPKIRLKELQTGNPFKLRIVKTEPTASAFQLERRLHGAMASSRREGEWFYSTPNHIIKTWHRIVRDFRPSASDLLRETKLRETDEAALKVAATQPV